MIAESIGLALLIVLESLTPPERLAFVLHDVFAVPYGNIGQIMERTPEAARQLASRARRGCSPLPSPTRTCQAQRRAVDAFLAAARHGDFEGLLEVLAPEVVLRFDPGAGPFAPFEITGAQAVARHVLRTAPRFLPQAIPAIVNGTPGVLYGTWDQPLGVLGFTVAQGKIAELSLITDRGKLHYLQLSLVPGPTERQSTAPAADPVNESDHIGHFLMSNVNHVVLARLAQMASRDALAGSASASASRATVSAASRADASPRSPVPAMSSPSSAPHPGRPRRSPRSRQQILHGLTSTHSADRNDRQLGNTPGRFRGRQVRPEPPRRLRSFA